METALKRAAKLTERRSLGAALDDRRRRARAARRSPASASPTTTRSTRSPGAGSSRAAAHPPTTCRSRPRRIRSSRCSGWCSRRSVRTPSRTSPSPRLPRAVRLRLGDLPARRRMVRLGGGRARGADLPHPQPRALLRRARLCRSPLPAARAQRAARRVARASDARRGPRACPCSCCSRSPGCCGPRPGSSPASTGCI